MKVIYTDQSYDSLEDLTQFLINELEWNVEKVLEFRTSVLDKADSLESNYNLYQEEEYLDHLEKGHRRAIEGSVKIIYRVDGELIYITDFFDTRQDPSKMKG